MNCASPRRRWRLPGPLARYLVYAGAAVAVIIWRGDAFEQFRARFSRPEQGLLVVAGTATAPDLSDRLLDQYRRKYPTLSLRVLEGNAAEALQDVLEGKAQIALLAREPDADERRIVRAHGDSVSTYPVALGGIGVVAATGAPFDSIRFEDLRGLIAGAPSPVGAERIYAPEPNRGLWGVLRDRLGIADALPPAVHWVADDEAVVEVVTGDPTAVGIVSTLALGRDEDGFRFVPLAGDTGAATLPHPGALASGAYPLDHYLWLACLDHTTSQASAMVTYFTSGRGQRAIERAGYLPAKEVGVLVRVSIDEPRDDARQGGA